MNLEKLFNVRNLQHWQWPEQSKLDAVFIPGRAEGNWEDSYGGSNDGLLSLAGDHNDLYRYIVIPGSDGSYSISGRRFPTGYPGWREWKENICRQGIPEHRVLLTLGHGLNTRTETDDFVSLAKGKGWTSGAVFMNQHETLRVMLGVLKSFEIAGHRMKIYPVTPRAEWDRVIYGSQGQKQMPRALHILEEFSRVVTYQKKGDLASFEELETYYKEVLAVDW